MLTTIFNPNFKLNSSTFYWHDSLFVVDSFNNSFSRLRITTLSSQLVNIYPASFLTAKLDIYNMVFYKLGFYKEKTLLITKNYNTHLLIYFWSKLTFRGKGFRVRKFFKARKLTLNFGRSHWTKIKFDTNYSNIHKIRRQNYIFFTPFFYNYYFFMYMFRHVKLINKYTKRGLRLKKQKIQKRFGKISQMISSLHF